MMPWWVWVLIAYAAIAVVVFVFHLMALQMVTPPLAALRALFWPLWVTTGWPRGEPIPFD